jgi:hypothetical protein
MLKVGTILPGQSTSWRLRIFFLAQMHGKKGEEINNQATLKIYLPKG